MAKKSPANKKLDPEKDFDEPTKPAPKQARLPGTEDARIDKLEDLAEEYADIREQGFSFLKKLKDIEKDLLAAMKDNGKLVYSRNGIVIRRIESSEKVKVRIKKDGDSGE